MSDAAAEAVPRPGVFTLTIRSKAALYAAWMPLLKGGGIFLPSIRSHALGEEILILVHDLSHTGLRIETRHHRFQASDWLTVRLEAVVAGFDAQAGMRQVVDEDED